VSRASRSSRALLQQAAKEGKVTVTERGVNRDALVSAQVVTLDPELLRPPLDLSEQAFTDLVIRFAQDRGWRVAHFRPAKTDKGWRTPCQGDAKGFPDLVMTRGPGHAVRLVVAELKSATGRPTVEQFAWLGGFEGASVPTYLWSPADWDEIVRVLA
jgi:hypothetical protein